MKKDLAISIDVVRIGRDKTVRLANTSTVFSIGVVVLSEQEAVVAVSSEPTFPTPELLKVRISKKKPIDETMILAAKIANEWSRQDGDTEPMTISGVVRDAPDRKDRFRNFDNSVPDEEETARRSLQMAQVEEFGIRVPLSKLQMLLR